MNYEEMLEYRYFKRVQMLRIPVIEVPWDEASRFGIMNTNEEMGVTNFVEKPDYVFSNLASMGIYIFKWSVLRAYLLEDAKNKESSHDFGKDIIPKLLQDEKMLFAYPFR